MKNWKTTIAGIIGAILVAGETLKPYFEGEGEINWYQVSAALIIIIGGYFAKDKDEPDNVVMEDTINPDPKPPRPKQD